jgi:hypothetical protein
MEKLSDRRSDLLSLVILRLSNEVLNTSVERRYKYRAHYQLKNLCLTKMPAFTFCYRRQGSNPIKFNVKN